MDATEISTCTGITDQCVKSALAQFNGDTRSALASIVQTFPTLPDLAFQPDGGKDAICTKGNVDKVNAVLKTTYARVNKVKGDCNDAPENDCWRALRENDWDSTKASAQLLKLTTPQQTEKVVDNSDSDDEEEERPPPKKLAEAPHNTGPLCQMDYFYEAEVEGRCTLMNLNYGFMQRNREKMPELRTRLLKWVDTAGSTFKDAPIQYYEIQDKDEETTRVIVKDVVRTFFHETTRERMISFLYAVVVEFGKYHQAISSSARSASWPSMNKRRWQS